MEGPSVKVDSLLVNAGTAPRPLHPPGTVAAARREAARVENAIRGMDDATVEELGGLNGYLRRLVEMRELLRTARPKGTIDGHSVWRFGLCKPMPPSPPGRSRTSDPYGKVEIPMKLSTLVIIGSDGQRPRNRTLGTFGEAAHKQPLDRKRCQPGNPLNMDRASREGLCWRALVTEGDDTR